MFCKNNESGTSKIFRTRCENLQVLQFAVNCEGGKWPVGAVTALITNKGRTIKCGTTYYDIGVQDFVPITIDCFVKKRGRLIKTYLIIEGPAYVVLVNRVLLEKGGNVREV